MFVPVRLDDALGQRGVKGGAKIWNEGLAMNPNQSMRAPRIVPFPVRRQVMFHTPAPFDFEIVGSTSIEAPELSIRIVPVPSNSPVGVTNRPWMSRSVLLNSRSQITA